MARAGPAEDRAAAHPAGLLAKSRSVMARLGLVFTTSPWTPPLGLGAALIDHIGGLGLSGWSIRQAHLRNYLLWRSGLGLDPRHPVLVLPRFSERAPRRVIIVLVLADLLAAERRAALAPHGLRERHLALSLNQTGLDPVALAEHADRLLTRAAEKSWLL